MKFFGFGSIIVCRVYMEGKFGEIIDEVVLIVRFSCIIE